MVYVVEEAIYLRKDDGSYQKHSLHKNASGQFYLEKEAGSLPKLPPHYESLTFTELVARYGATARGPEAPAKKTTSK